MLKPIGWWIETLADEKLPAPQEFVGELPSERRTALANYLSGGLRLIQYRGYSWCRFACGVGRSRMGSWDITDGVWVWPEGLAHYVQVHQVILPDEFMSRALSGASATSSRPPQDYDADYWTHWCAARRVPAIKEGLRRTLLAAQARVSALKAERIDALERTYGLAEQRCVWAQCTRKAVVGGLVCAAHSLSASDLSAAEMPLFTGLQEYLRQLSAAAQNKA